MSDKKYPQFPGHRHPGRPVVGALSGWNKVTTNRGDGEAPKGDHEFTIPDLLRLVRALREEFSHERIAAVEELIQRHTSREDNPHLDDLKKLNTSVLQELYNLWLSEGYQGTREEFLKVLFQYVKIADIDTTIRGEAHDEVVHALGLKTVMDIHDQSLDAHDPLFEMLFPGDPIKASPSFALEPYLGLPENAIVIRNSPMTIVTDTGIVKEIPKNTLETDYSTGKAAIPIFGSLINEIEESENFGNSNSWRVRYAKLEQTVGIQSMRNYTDDSWVLKEIRSETPVVHELIYARETFNILANEYYTISLFVSPMGRDCIGIEVMDNFDEEGRFGFFNSGLQPFDQGTFAGAGVGKYRAIHFDVKNEVMFINSNSKDLHGHIYPMLNGWYRIQLTFRALRSMPLQFRAYLLDIVDGDSNYEGTTDLGMAIFGVTGTKGPYLPPYIPSIDGTKGSIAGTTLQIPVTDWYRFDAGTVVMQMNNHALDCRLSANSEIYNFGNGVTALALFARFPVGHNNRIYIGCNTTTNAQITAKWTQASKRDWLDMMHAYSYSNHVFGGAENDVEEVAAKAVINKNVKFLYLGCDRQLRNHLNGFITKLTYYPEVLVAGNMKFFTGRK